MYLSFGMTPEQYWEGPPELATAYRKKYELETEVANTRAWLQGMYFYDALTATLSQALATKNKKGREYSEEPYRITPYTEEELEAKKKEDAKKALDHAISQFNAMKEVWDKKNGRNR